MATSFAGFLLSLFCYDNHIHGFLMYACFGGRVCPFCAQIVLMITRFGVTVLCV